MFDRFDDQARHATARSQEVARSDGAPAITPDHLARAVLAGPRTTAARTLAALGIDRGTVLASIEAGAGPGPGSAPEGSLPFTPETKAVLGAAAQAAHGLGDHHIGSEHLLLGVVVQGTSLATQVLVAHGAGAPALGQVITGVPGRGGPVGTPASGRVGRTRERRGRRGRSPVPAPVPSDGPDASLTPRLAAHLRALWDAGRTEDLLAEAVRLLESGEAPADARPTVGLYGALAVVTLPRPERYVEADGWLEGAIAQPEARGLALHLRARILSSQGRRAEAAQVLDVALAEASPEDPRTVPLWVSRLAAATDATDTTRLLDGVEAPLRAAASSGDRAAVLVVAASAIATGLLAERFDAARAMVVEAATLAPHDESAQVVRWLLGAVDGRAAEAVEGLRGSLAPDSTLPDHVLGTRHACLARALLDLGDEAGARRHAEEAQRLGCHRPVLVDVWRRLDDAAGAWLPPG